MNSKLLLRYGLSTALLTILYCLTDLIFGAIPHQPLIYYGWLTISDTLIIFILGYYIVHSTQTGLRITTSTFLIYYIIGHFNILIEALIFEVTDRIQTIHAMAVGLLIAVVISPAFVLLLDQWNEQKEKIEFKRRSVYNWIWRILIGVLFYVIIYVIAGFSLQAVYPELMEFYIDKIPPFDLIIGTQFIRGFLFVGIAILILRTLRLSRIKKAVLIGLIFSIFGGIAPLIPPNELMPANVRIGHGFEVGISNFIYGLVLGYLLNQKPKE